MTDVRCDVKECIHNAEKRCQLEILNLEDEDTIGGRLECMDYKWKKSK